MSKSLHATFVTLPLLVVKADNIANLCAARFLGVVNQRYAVTATKVWRAEEIATSEPFGTGTPRVLEFSLRVTY